MTRSIEEQAFLCPGSLQPQHTAAQVAAPGNVAHREGGGTIVLSMAAFYRARYSFDDLWPPFRSLRLRMANQYCVPGNTLGAMYPKGKRNESLIVAFADRPQPTPARVLARLRMHVQGFSVLPALHSSEYFLNLHERTPDGTLRHVVLELDELTLRRIAREIVR